MFISGIVGSGKTQNRQVAKKAPTRAKPESRIKQLSRWYQNKENRYEIYYLPFIESLLAHLAELPLVVSMDGSEVGRGFHLHKSHVDDPERLSRILIAACLAYIWIVFLGAFVHQQNLVSVIHRTDRCDLSLFQIGLDWLEHCLNEMLPIPVSFNLPSEFLFA